jgi:hypothetical protein
MQDSRTTLERGAIAGAIGATTLALFFLAYDLIRGTPLRTPALVASVGAARDPIGLSMLPIVIFTLIHFALFIVVGIAVTWLIGRFYIRPHVLLGAVFGFLLFDLLFYAGSVVTGVNVVREIGWPAVLAANMIAGVAMFAYLKATAPEPRSRRAGSPSAAA